MVGEGLECWDNTGALGLGMVVGMLEEDGPRGLLAHMVPHQGTPYVPAGHPVSA